MKQEKRDRPFWWDHAQLGLPNRPVVGISWYEAAAYARWLGVQLRNAGSKLRVWRAGQSLPADLEAEAWNVQLPSEAEWEKAARGTDGRRYPWGPEWQEDCANTREAGLGQTSAVGLFPGGASPFGCLDMVGNVWEWTRSLMCKNWMNPEFKYPYRSDDGRENPKAGDDVYRVLRGGSFYFDPYAARCSCRAGLIPSGWSRDVGFRVVVAPSRP